LEDHVNDDHPQGWTPKLKR